MAIARASYRDLDGDVSRFLTRALGREMAKVGQEIVNETTALLTNGTGKAGVRVRSGRLRGSIESSVVEQRGRIVIVVGTRVEYAKLVHDGRKAIRPVDRKALKFVTPGGKVVIRASAKRAEPRPFLTTGAQRALAKRGISLRIVDGV